MEHLRDSVRLRAYGQRDPLVEYKNEGSQLFHQLQDAIKMQVVNAIFKIGAPIREDMQTPRIQFQHPESVGFGLETSSGAASGVKQISPQTEHQTISSTSSVGRNDSCPCGSGKKYKRCGDLNTEEHKKLMNK